MFAFGTSDVVRSLKTLATRRLHQGCSLPRDRQLAGSRCSSLGSITTADVNGESRGTFRALE
jgi:hypothetical protein